MIDQVHRLEAYSALRRFIDCVTTNEEYLEEYPSERSDRGIRAIDSFTWNFYDDFEEHKLQGAYALWPESSEMAHRCLLFLLSDYEYQWQVKDFTFEFGWGRILRILKRKPTPKSFIEKFAEKLNQPEGDSDVWPFFRKSDYEKALERSKGASTNSQ